MVIGVGVMVPMTTVTVAIGDSALATPLLSTGTPIVVSPRPGIITTEGVEMIGLAGVAGGTIIVSSVTVKVVPARVMGPGPVGVTVRVVPGNVIVSHTAGVTMYVVP